MSSKEERYFSGRPSLDPRQPLPGEVPPERRRLFVRLAQAIVLVAVGVLIGLYAAPETPASTQETLDAMSAELESARGRIAELEKTLAYRANAASAVKQVGHLRAKDRARHEREGAKYARALRKANAQGAAELVQWFIQRWDELLDAPEPDDRIGRRAATLSLLVGGMAANLNPKDYVPWQAEFLSGNWLGELHFDIDGDGLPGTRASPNPRDSFADVSVCHIAMALNQAVRDAQVLVMPDMRCDRPEARMSVFLQGSTLDDALNAFVQALRDEKFLVIERLEHNMRLILVGARPQGQSLE